MRASVSTGFVTDGSWRCRNVGNDPDSEVPGWMETDFDDSQWETPRVGNYFYIAILYRLHSVVVGRLKPAK